MGRGTMSLLGVLGLVAAAGGPSPAGARLRGRLVDEGSGNPVVGKVLAFEEEDEGERLQRLIERRVLIKPVLEVPTDEDGQYDLVLPDKSKSYLVQATAPGRARLTLDEAFDGAGPDRLLAEIRLQKGASLSGRLLRPDGSPLARAAVLFTVGGPLPTVQAETSENGRFQLDGLPEEGGRLVAMAPGFAPLLREAWHGGKLLEARLTPALSVQGTVIDAKTGLGVAGIFVEGVDAAAGSVARSGANGRFVLDGLPAGEVVLTTHGDAYMPARWEGRLPRAEGAEPIVLALRPGSSLQIVARRARDGAPVPNARVTIGWGSWAEGNRHRTVRTDARGGVTVTGLPGTSIRLEVSARGFLPSRSTLALKPEEARKASIALQEAASVSGVVVDGAARPLRAVTVTAERRSTATDRDGTFLLDGLAPEALSLVFRGAERARKEVWLRRLVPGEARKGLRIVMEQGGAVAGRVVDRDGSPIVGADVTASDVLGREREPRVRIESARDGTFLLRALPVGPVSIHADAAEYVPSDPIAVSVVPAHATTVGDVRLRPAASLRGWVLDRSRRPVSGAFVDAGPPPLGSGASTQTDETGAFTLEKLDPEDELVVTASLDGYRTTRKTGVRAGPAPVELWLDAGLRLRGCVVSKEPGEPVSPVTVQWSKTVTAPGAFSRLRAGHRVTVESRDGKFEFSGLEPGKIDLTVRAPGYHESLFTGIEVPEEGSAEQESEMTFQLDNGFTISGYVLGPARKPIPLASVCVAGAPRGCERLWDDIVTDAEGAFRLDEVAAGVRSLLVRAEGWVDAAKEIEVKGNMEGVEIVLSPGVAVTGRVLRQDGMPAAGALIALSPSESGPKSILMSRQEIAGEDGAFRFEAVSTGAYELQATTGSGAGSPKVPLVVGRANPPPVILQIQTGVRIEGQITGLSQEELRGVQVGGWGAVGPLPAAVVQEGRFTFEEVFPGPVTLVASTEGYLPRRRVSKQLTLLEDEPLVQVELPFPTGSRLSGRITRAGKAVRGAFLMAEQAAGDKPPPYGGMGSQVTSESDADGNYRVESLAEGRYTVSVTQLDGSIRYETEVTINGDTTHDIDIPAALVEGRVLSSSDREPISAARLVFKLQDRSPFTSMAAESDANGRFAFSDVADGDYLLSGQADGHGAASERVSVSMGEAPGNVELLLQPEALLRLRIVDARTGTSPSSASVSTYEGQTITRTVQLAAEGGVFRVPGLPAGAASLVVRAPGAAMVTLPAVRVPGETTISVSGGGQIRLLLASGSGEARLIRADGAIEWLMSASSFGAPEVDARVSAPVATIESVSPGSYRLLVMLGGEARELPVRIREGDTTEVRLE